MDDYYDHDTPIRPGVVVWFKIYTAFLSFLYFLVAAVSFIFFLVDPGELDMQPAEAKAVGAVLLLMGTVLFFACIVPLFLAPKPWVWIYDLVVICLGMTSACTMLICIPLLIFWLKPETKRYFERT